MEGCVCIFLRGHNDIELNIIIEDVVSEVAAVFHRSCTEHTIWVYTLLLSQNCEKL